MKNKQIQKNIPDGWERKKLSEIGKAFIGLTYSPDDVVQDGGVLVFRSSNIKSGKIDYSDQVRVSANISEKNFVREGDILICARNGSRGLIGKNAYISKKDEGNAFGAFMSVFRSENPRYTYQLFQSSIYKKEIERDLGPTINQVTTGNLLKFKFNFPPLPEQNHIVKVLETWDLYIEKLGRKIELKKNIKKGLMQKLLTSKLRLSGFSGEWEMVKLGDVCELYQPKTITSEEIKTIGKYKVFGANGIIGYFDKYNHEEKEVLVTCRGATCGRINYSDPKSWITGNAMVAKPNKAVLYKDYLFYLLNFSNLNSVITGLAQPQITRKDLSPFLITLPNFKEQTAIANILTKADQEIEVLEKKKEIIESQKKYLLNNLITGKIRTPENLKIN